MTDGIRRGSVIWVRLSPSQGREQDGVRPAVVICNGAYLAAVPDLVIVVPVTSRDRGWPHHVRLIGTNLKLGKNSFAMTEQPRTIDRSRITRQAGVVDATAMAEIDQWLRDFTSL